MFTLSDNYSPLLDERIYRPIGQISTKLNDSENILVRKTISLEICSKVFNESYKYYEAMEDLNLNNFYCLSLNKSKNNDIDKKEFYINEFWGNNGFQMLKIKLYNCSAIAKNKSECASDEEMKKRLNSPILSYYTLNNLIDTNNFKEPFVRGIQEHFYYLSYKKMISATQYLKHLRIKTDKGLLFYEEEIKDDSTIDSMISYSVEEPTDGRFFTMSIQLINYIDIYTRSYYKFQDLGSDIGAIYGVLHMFFSI